MQIPISVSNRHIHLSQQHLEELFGEDYQLTKKYDLLQPDQFAAEEKITLIGPNGVEVDIRVVGPIRSETQCEILISDVEQLGFKNIPIRISGDIQNSPSFRLRGPYGSCDVSRGLIIAKRHMHCDPQTANKLNISNEQSISVQVEETIISDILVRIHDCYKPEIHLDSDEAQYYAIKPGSLATIV